MATKMQQQNKAQRVGNNSVVEQHTVIEESILPAADELKKLQEIDPSLVKWVMDRCEKEQNFRHEFSNGRLNLTKKDLNGTILINVLCIVFAFILILCGFAASIFLIKNGLNIAGTIFAGASIIGVGALFTRIPSKNKKL